jgi:predicted anti-sigma-YlaC factor YlaD
MALRRSRHPSHPLATALVRAAPFVLGAAAAAVWLRRRQAPPPALPRRAGIEPPPVPPPPAPAPARRSRRFIRRPVDIVTVVDDLLGSTR